MTTDPHHLEMTVHMDGSVVAAATSILIARGAFDAAVKLYPEAVIHLRHRARLIEKWPADRDTENAGGRDGASSGPNSRS